MTFDEIRAMPTSVTTIPAGASGVHESCLRSFHIVEKVTEIIHEEMHTGTVFPRAVLLDLIAMLRTDLPKTMEGD